MCYKSVTEDLKTWHISTYLIYSVWYSVSTVCCYSTKVWNNKCFNMYYKCTGIFDYIVVFVYKFSLDSGCVVMNNTLFCFVLCFSSNKSCSMSVRGLFQAVRSQLHFSQLSAWWSSSKGTVPKNVCYRVTLPGEAFASHFSRPPLEHSFPTAAINSESILKVCNYYY